MNNEINLTHYIQYLNDLSKSSNTIKSYTEHINEFLKFNNNPITITRKHLLTYKNHLNNKNNSATTICTKLSAIRSYNEYLIYTNKQTETIVIKADFPKIQRECIAPAKCTEKEALKLIDTIKQKESFRDYTIASILYNTGVRISEALDIQLDDLIFNQHKCIIRHGKGNKARTIILNNAIINIIKEYIQNHRPKYNYANKSPYLFCSNQSPRITYQRIEQIFDKYSKNVNPHQNRHLYGTWGMKPKSQGGAGMSLVQLKALMGHASFNSTQIYTHVDLDEMVGIANSR